MIQIFTISRTVRVYGYSTSSRRLSGLFCISGIEDIANLICVTEGHVNTHEMPVRLFSFLDDTKDLVLSTFISRRCGSSILLSGQGEEVEILVERVSVEVVGFSINRADNLRYHGKAVSHRYPSDVVDLYEVDSSSFRQFYMNAPDAVIQHALDSIIETGIYELSQVGQDVPELPRLKSKSDDLGAG